MDKKEYKQHLKKIEGKTIGLVYVFEGDDNVHYNHYDPWKSEVIADWLYAIQVLRCMPLIIDVKTFVQKAVTGTLPKIDYIVNLNAGTNTLCTLAIVPSICAYINIPCIPSDSITTLVGENKKFSNILAEHVGLNLPANLNASDNSGVFRPINFGSSKGVQIGFPRNWLSNQYLYQKFIPGFDVTIPIAYNPLEERLECLTPLAYLPKSKDPNWYLGDVQKNLKTEYKKEGISISDECKKSLLSYANLLNITSFCRIDTRVLCSSFDEFIKIIHAEVTPSLIYFMEINPMPTIKNNINFSYSYELSKNNCIWKSSVQTFNEHFSTNSFIGFLLANSIISHIKAMH